MKTEFQHNLIKFIAAAVLVIAPLTAYALPSANSSGSYSIGVGGGGGFGASYIHAATNEMGSTGYFANGTKTSISGTLTFDLHAGTAGGSLTGYGDFGQGVDNWIIAFTGSTDATSGMFEGGTVDSLLSLDYRLTNAGGTFLNTGTFYFADRIFAGNANSRPGSELFLWGNNWINASSDAKSKRAFEDKCRLASKGTVAIECATLGLDLYGKSVPEPGMLALLAMGLVGFGVAGRK